MQRIFDAVCRESPLILEPGFTISGGIEVVESTTDRSFEDLFKAADEKLYVAKTSGKISWFTDQLITDSLFTH